MKPDFTVTVNKQGKAFGDNTDKNYLDFVSESWQNVGNIPPGLMLQTNKGK